MEKTTEQKEASKQRYLAQENTAVEKLMNANNLYEYLEGLKYLFSFCIRYSKNFKNFVLKCEQIDRLDKCLKSGILKEWNDTFWFDKEKCTSLQEFILSHN